MINKGTRARTEHITQISRRLRYFLTSHIDTNWKTLVNAGSAASNPIWKLVAFNNIAIAIKKVPLVSVDIASAASPSFTIKCKPDCTCFSVSLFEVRKFICIGCGGKTLLPELPLNSKSNGFIVNGVKNGYLYYNGRKNPIINPTGMKEFMYQIPTLGDRIVGKVPNQAKPRRGDRKNG